MSHKSTKQNFERKIAISFFSTHKIKFGGEIKKKFNYTLLSGGLMVTTTVLSCGGFFYISWKASWSINFSLYLKQVIFIKI